MHDADAAKILEKLIAMRDGAGLLAYPAAPRALAVMYWASAGRRVRCEARKRWHRAAQSLARLADVLGDRGARKQLADEIARAIAAFVAREKLARRSPRRRRARRGVPRARARGRPIRGS